MRRFPATASLLRQINRSAVVQFVRREGVVSPSSVADRLKISLPTATRVLHGLVQEGLAAYDGFDESTRGRGRPRARVRFKGDTHAIIGVEATKSVFYGAVSDLDGNIQAELTAPVGASDKDNVDRLIRLIRNLKKTRRPRGQRICGIGVGVPSIVRQPDGVVVLTLGLGWKDLPLKEILAGAFDEPVFVENGRNLAAVGEWGFGAGRGASSVVSLAIGPGAGAGVVLDGKLCRGWSNAVGEISWYLDDPELTGRAFPHLGDRESLRYGQGIPHRAISELQAANRDYVRGGLSLAELFGSTSPQLAAVKELIDYAIMAAGSISALLNPEIIVLAGQAASGAPLIVDAIADRLKTRVYDPPRIVVSDLGHRDIVMGAIMTVLDVVALNPGVRSTDATASTY